MLYYLANRENSEQVQCNVATINSNQHKIQSVQKFTMPIKFYTVCYTWKIIKLLWNLIRFLQATANAI